MAHPLLIPELLSRVFSCPSLSKQELAMCCLVCHLWYDMAQLYLWRQLDLDQEGSSQNHGLFSSHSRRKAILASLASKGHLVRTLTIPDCRSDLGFLRQMVHDMPRLETIVVDRVALGHHLSVLTQLVDSDASKGYRRLSSSTTGLPRQSQDQSPLLNRYSLRSLRLPHVTEQGRGTAMLLELCRRNPGLRHLELMDNELDDGALKQLSRLCPDLLSLDLSRSEYLVFGEEFFTRDAEEEEEEDDNKTMESDTRGDQEEMCDCCQYCRQQVRREMVPYPTELQQRGHKQQGHTLEFVDDHQEKQQQQKRYSQEYHDPYSSRLLTGNENGRDGPSRALARQCRQGSDWARGRATQQQQQYCSLMEGLKGRQGSIEDRGQGNPHQTNTTNTTHNNNASGHSTVPFPLLCSTTTTTTKPCPCAKWATVPPPSFSRPKQPPRRPRFSRLEHLSLVFCLGISNTGFQRFFDSLYGSCLQSINLEFTLIQDTGLLTLARACGGTGGFYSRHRRQPAQDLLKPTSPVQPLVSQTVRSSLFSTGLTSVCVNYCSQITHEGLWALIDYCPRLESLEFVGCDAVSALVFDPTRPWRCTRLRRLVFTLQPTVLMMPGGKKDDHDLDILGVSSPPSPSSVMALTDTAAAAAAASIQDKERAAQQEQRHAILQDYRAMFRQLKRLTRLESLHIYNSPLVNAHLPCVDDDVVVTGLVGAEQQQQQQQPVEDTITHADRRRSRETTKHQQQRLGQQTCQKAQKQHCSPFLNEASSSSSTSSYNKASLDHLARADDKGEDEDEEDGQLPQKEEQEYQHQPQHVQEPPQPLQTALHPFIFYAGLKALRHLQHLRALTLYERASIVLGDPELRWMGRTFPCLRRIKLKGAIHPHGGAVRVLEQSQPLLQVQVCRLFEEQTL